MNVPVHQIMFTSDRDALPLPAAEEVRTRSEGDPYRMRFLDDARALISDVYELEALRPFEILRPFAYKADLDHYWIVNYIGEFQIDLPVSGFHGFDLGGYEFVGLHDPNSAGSSGEPGDKPGLKSRSGAAREAVR